MDGWLAQSGKPHLQSVVFLTKQPVFLKESGISAWRQSATITSPQFFRQLVSLKLQRIAFLLQMDDLSQSLPFQFSNHLQGILWRKWPIGDKLLLGLRFTPSMISMWFCTIGLRGVLRGWSQTRLVWLFCISLEVIEDFCLHFDHLLHLLVSQLSLLSAQPDDLLQLAHHFRSTLLILPLSQRRFTQQGSHVGGSRRTGVDGAFERSTLSQQGCGFLLELRAGLVISVVVGRSGPDSVLAAHNSIQKDISRHVGMLFPYPRGIVFNYDGWRHKWSGRSCSSSLPGLFEGHDSPAYLHALLDPRQLYLQSLLSHQCSKFGLIVEDVVVTAHFLDFGVVTRYRDISHAHLAIMSTAQFYPLGGDVLDDHHVIGLFRYTLQDYMISFRLFYRKQFIFHSCFLDVTRVLILTHLAVKLLKIILSSPTHYFLLHLRLVPLLQTSEMDQAAGA